MLGNEFVCSHTQLKNLFCFLRAQDDSTKICQKFFRRRRCLVVVKVEFFFVLSIELKGLEIYLISEHSTDTSKASNVLRSFLQQKFITHYNNNMHLNGDLKSGLVWISNGVVSIGLFHAYFALIFATFRTSYFETANKRRKHHLVNVCVRDKGTKC